MKADTISEGLFRVVDPGMSLPSIFDATYFDKEPDATQYAIEIWNKNGRMGEPLVHHVMPYRPARRVDIDFEALRSSPPEHFQDLHVLPLHTVKVVHVNRPAVRRDGCETEMKR